MRFAITSDGALIRYLEAILSTISVCQEHLRGQLISHMLTFVQLHAVISGVRSAGVETTTITRVSESGLNLVCMATETTVKGTLTYKLSGYHKFCFVTDLIPSDEFPMGSLEEAQNWQPQAVRQVDGDVNGLQGKTRSETNCGAHLLTSSGPTE